MIDTSRLAEDLFNHYMSQGLVGSITWEKASLPTRKAFIKEAEFIEKWIMENTEK